MNDESKTQLPGMPGRSKSDSKDSFEIDATEAAHVMPLPDDASTGSKPPLKKTSRIRSTVANKADVEVENEKALKETLPKARKKPARRAAMTQDGDHKNRSREEAENSIEQSRSREAKTTHHVRFSVADVETAQSASAAKISTRRHPFATIGRVVRNLGVWFSDFRKPKNAHKLDRLEAISRLPVSTSSSQPAPLSVDLSAVVPEAVARRFLKVEREYYFFDRTPAFSDRGNKLATRSAHPEVVRSLVDIARARGWSTLTVKGTDEFRRSAWMEAAQHGLKVSGYQPTPVDLAELANRPAYNSVERTQRKDKGAAKGAKYPDTAHAIKEAPPVAAQDVKEASSIRFPLKPNPDLEKKIEAFEKNKPAFVVKKYPDLAGAYGIVEAAKTFAFEKLPKAVREEFVGMARQHVLHKIAAGEMVKGPKIYMARSKNQEADATQKAFEQGVSEVDSKQRIKDSVRER